MRRVASFVSMVSLCAQTQVKPIISQRQFGDRVNVVRLAPRYATAIRMPESESRRRFESLTDYERDSVVEFLKSLQVLPPGTSSYIVDEHFKSRPWPPAVPD